MLNAKYDKNTKKYTLCSIEDLDQSKKNPFDAFGFGIISYFLVLRLMIFTFICLSLIFIPVMVIYLRGKNYLDESNSYHYW